MGDFSEQIERAAEPLPLVWRLMVWNVPDNLHALLYRFGFRPARKNPQHWWRLFDPRREADREFATRVRGELIAAGLKGKWQQVGPVSYKPRKAYRGGPKPKPSYGYTDFARHNTAPGSWRVKKRRQ